MKRKTAVVLASADLMTDGAPGAARVVGLDAAREANHRISNNLSLIAGLIRMQRNALDGEVDSVSPAEVAAILGTVAGRIDAIGNLHGLLAKGDGSERMDVGNLIRGVCEPLVASLALPGQIDLSFDLQQHCKAIAEQALPIALIVNEAVTNSLKYAHPTGVAGLLHVACGSESDGSLVIQIVDDGVGLPEDFDATSGGGVGMKIIRSLCKQLKAEFTLSDKPIGLEFRLRVPPCQPKPADHASAPAGSRIA